VNQFLSHLAVKRRVAASTQNQALCALVFLYRHVLQKELGELGDIVRAKHPVRLPEVLTHEEIMRLMGHMDGVYKRLTDLMYGAGLRLMETVRLRAQNVAFGYNYIYVRDGKGGKVLVTMLPQSIRTTQIYPHVLNRGGLGVLSLVDSLDPMLRCERTRPVRMPLY